MFPIIFLILIYRVPQILYSFLPVPVSAQLHCLSLLFFPMLRQYFPFIFEHEQENEHFP
jgi:hypothetical protein